MRKLFYTGIALLLVALSGWFPRVAAQGTLPEVVPVQVLLPIVALAPDGSPTATATVNDLAATHG
jgi:hypothetical protein